MSDYNNIQTVNNVIYYSELFNKYKPSYYDALQDLTIHTSFMSITLYLLYLSYVLNASVLSLPIIILLALLLNRSFIIFHDCCHNSYTPNKTANFILAHIIGISILTSPNWALDHHDHHLTVGNVDTKPEQKHSWYDADIMSKKHFKQLSNDEQQLYTLYKHPAIFFTIAPLFHFVIFQRFIYIDKKIKNPHKYRQSLFIITLNHLINNIGIILLMVFMYRHKIWLQYSISLLMYYSIKFMTLHNQHVFNPPYMAVSYTHLTLPTIYSV